MQKNGFIEILAVAALLVLAFFVGIWTTNCGSELDLQSQSRPFYDSIPQTVVARIDTVYKDSIIYQPIPQDIDSFAVATAYYAKVPFSFKGQTEEVSVTGKGFISQNRIDTVTLNIINFRPTKIIKPVPRNSLSIGVIAGRDLMAPKLCYQRKNWEIGIGYDLLTQNRVGLLFELNYRLKTW